MQQNARILRKLSPALLGGGLFFVLLGSGGCPGGGMAPAGPPSGPFSFTASTYSVNIPVNTLSSDVDFWITSDGTFSGDVVVHWEATGDCTPSPSDNDTVVSVAPGAPGTFKRKMYRWSANGRNLKWTATHAGSNTTKTLDIAYTH
jgi:hypothetical protein